MIETGNEIINVSFMFVALFLVMGSCISIFVKVFFYIDSDLKQSIGQRCMRISFWLGLGGFGNALVNTCLEKAGDFSTDFVLMFFNIVLALGVVWWVFIEQPFYELSCKKVALLIERMIVYPIFYSEMLWGFTWLLREKLVLSENWVWQITTVLAYYFLGVKMALALSNKIKEWNREKIVEVKIVEEKISSDSRKISGGM